MSVTLSIPPAIVQEIRLWADANETSLNQYVRDCLEAKVNEIQAARRRQAKEFFAYCNDNLVETPKGWRYDRERDGVRAMSRTIFRGMRLASGRNMEFRTTMR